MNRAEFMAALEAQLRDITTEERDEALKFYNEYLDEAGPENEAAVLAELGSPEKVAAIIKANVPGSRAEQAAEQPAAPRQEPQAGPAPELTLEGPDWAAGKPQEQPQAEEEPPQEAQPEHQIPLPVYARPRPAGMGAAAQAVPQYTPHPGGAQPRRLSNNAILLIVLAVLLLPLWGGLLTGALGVLFGFLCVGFALVIAGGATIVAVIAVLAANASAAFAAGIPVGLITVGLCLAAAALGVLLIAGGLWFNFRAIPALWRGLKKAINWLFGRRKEA
mgnify:CR=1 FL=1